MLFNTCMKSEHRVNCIFDYVTLNVFSIYFSRLKKSAVYITNQLILFDFALRDTSSVTHWGTWGGLLSKVNIEIGMVYRLKKRMAFTRYFFYDWELVTWIIFKDSFHKARSPKQCSIDHDLIKYNESFFKTMFNAVSVGSLNPIMTSLIMVSTVGKPLLMISL